MKIEELEYLVETLFPDYDLGECKDDTYLLINYDGKNYKEIVLDDKRNIKFYRAVNYGSKKIKFEL